ncbi:MAG: exodeoxyribonuclease V subunit gamma [Chitinophagaceae bacterium]
MSLFLKVSNSLTSLAEGLSKNLKTSRNSVFEPHWIVIQTEGMNNWLKLQIAGHLGIAANCRFLKPNDLIHKIYYWLGGPFTEMLSPQNLNWLLFKLLGENEFTQKFPAIAAYFSESSPDKDIKRMALAEKLSDLFDQYQIYRPDMIRQWNENIRENVDSTEWQQWLWIKARQVSENSLPDKTVVGAYILEAIENPEQQKLLREKLPTVHLFGLSITTEYHLQILFRLSTLIDVYFHIINPAPYIYWFEDAGEKQLALWRQKGRTHLAEGVIGNALLTSWGRVIQETFGMFFQHDEFLNAYEDVDIINPEPDSLLHKIQHDIFSAATDARNLLTLADINDGSVTLNACFTIAREVEVLYNYLVYLVDKKRESLSPRDIVVMVSDIDAYAPYIKAVFNNAPHKFRYTIADESFADGDNIFQAIESILLMNGENFKAEEVMQLLDSSFIRKRFSLSDINRIRTIVNSANIRFGIDGDKEDETNLVSWKYGISRIMYGICMSGEEEYGEGSESFFPLDILEGSSALELIRFCHFVEVLIDSIEQREGSRNIADWVKYMEEVLHNLVHEQDDDPDENYTRLMQQLEDYNIVNQYMNDEVPFDVFNHSFLKTLNGTTRSGLFANGGITFCSLIPMRSIPFKVVVLLGLGFDKFPRKERAPSFNLMEKKRQRGDRNVKENDKHLFLETVLSAQQYLYISYVGRSARDNTVLPPSTVIDELIEYIEAGLDSSISKGETHEVRKRMVTLHPLQGFSSRYSEGEKNMYSYLETALVPAKLVINPGKLTDPFSFEEITLEDLVRFFGNPFQAYYNKVLGIFYNQEEVLLNDTEIFSLDNLQKWDVKNKLLPLDKEEHEQLQKKLVRTGSLPLSHMADLSLKQIEEMVSPVRELFQSCTQSTDAQSISVELTIDDHLLKGRIHGVYNRKLVQVSWSKGETKYLIKAYIRYLAGVAAGELSGLYFISSAKEEVYETVAITQQEAVERLLELIDIYTKGFEEIATFWPDFEVKPSDIDTLDSASFEKLVKKKLDSYLFPCTDEYIMNEYGKGHFSREGIHESYIDICRKVIAPLEKLFPAYYAKK